MKKQKASKNKSDWPEYNNAVHALEMLREIIDNGHEPQAMRDAIKCINVEIEIREFGIDLSSRIPLPNGTHDYYRMVLKN